MTFGCRSVQECKFKLSGLEPYFDQTFYVEQGSKAKTIKNYLDLGVSCEKVVFIDVTIEHLKAFVAEITTGQAIRIARPGAKGSEVANGRFKTVTSCLEVLKMALVP